MIEDIIIKSSFKLRFKKSILYNQIYYPNIAESKNINSINTNPINSYRNI